MEYRRDTHAQASQEAPSLVLRLAGPSTTKAGLSTEQTEINRVIAEASKGSKFYENEKRKDKEVTARIERILKLRDEVMKGIDILKVEQKVDHLLEVIERERDLTQFIVHVDMDAFYANVELLDDPSLAGKPFGVGYGVLSTASYEARKYGVRSGMPGYIARKLCPDLIFVKLNMSRYTEVSKRIMAIFRQYDPNMLAASVDEAYLNITEYCAQHNLNPDECVEWMRQRVFDETKLTVSAGIAANKMLAKICSDKVRMFFDFLTDFLIQTRFSNKNKPNGQFHLPHNSEAIKDFMRDLPIRKIPGIGRVSERLLDSITVKTCGDIYKCRGVLSLLDKQFGLRSMLRVHLGIGSNIVQPWAREEKKSIGSERTFKAISEKEKILLKLEDIAAELEDDMERGGWAGRTVTLKYKLDTYEVFTRAKSFNRWIKTKAELYEAGKELLQPEWPLCLRLIGLRVTKLKDLQKKDDGIEKFLEPLPYSPSKNSPSKKSRAYDSDNGQDSDVEYIEPDVEADLEDNFNFNALADNEDEPPTATTSEPRPSTSGYRPPPMFAPGPSTLETPSPSRSSPSRPIMPTSSARVDAPPQGEGEDPEKQGGLHMREGDDKHEDESTTPKACSDSANALLESTSSTAAVSECPLCTRPFATNDELNAHIDWCLSRDAIRSAQVEGDRAERRKSDVGVQHPKEWWKGGFSESTAVGRKPKRRRKLGE